MKQTHCIIVRVNLKDSSERQRNNLTSEILSVVEDFEGQGIIEDSEVMEYTLVAMPLNSNHLTKI